MRLVILLLTVVMFGSTSTDKLDCVDACKIESDKCMGRCKKGTPSQKSECTGECWNARMACERNCGNERTTQ